MPADPRAEALLIVAVSGRGLAAAARRSGYAPVVIDFWLDQDTRRLCRAGYRMAGRWRRGFRRASLLSVAHALIRATGAIGIVCGTGFEDRPGLLTALAGVAPLFGNDAPTVRRVKRPLLLAELARDLGIPHPDIRLAPPDAPGWVAKRAGGAGGGHVAPADPTDGTQAGGGRYWQRQVPGVPVSALLLADGRRALVLGFSAQWADPTQGAPFRWAGAVRPAGAMAHADAMADAAQRLARCAGLRGLNSVDFLVSERGFHMIEINPRPGASLDVFRHRDLMRLHIEACQGRLPEAAPAFAGAMATRIVYAPRDVTVPPGFAWPDWTADQDSARMVAAGEPICSVFAEAEDAGMAREGAERRAATLLAALRAA